MANRPRVVVVGTGFAGYHCLRTLESLLGPDDADLVAVNPTDYMLYLPLLPEVTAGILDPRRIAVPLRTKLPRTRLVLGSVSDVDVADQKCTVVDIEGRESVLEWDRLVITSGSVTRLLSIPGVAEYAKGFRSIAEAVFLRDHILRQLELAEQSDDPAERAARTTFVVVGAGYTGTELAAQGQLLTREALRRYKGLSEKDVRWLLVDMAPRVLPGLSKRLSGPALRVLRRRGVDVRLQTSVKEVTATCVKLTDDTEIPTRTVAWCVGVRPDPLVESTQLEAVQGRIAVDRKLRTAANQNVFAAGDVAAVPDATRPGEITPMTAQHAQRQGKVAGVNVAASLGHGMMHQYKHHDLGFLVDLAGPSAVADPLHIPISGLPAKAITRGYHLLALPGNRARVLADWAIDLVSTRQFVQLGLVRGTSMEDADQPPM
ncbi:NAD(P)/FAD-dependent oxidoreductase [Actinocrispum sp. NPDC049592]|uniref:NAD(P)/FAD-dependent oxidoreductase n=1 Tax=Actinocrispum sp. NPDC049592 TaxID=3154835 RepID=UPI003433938B